MNQSDKKLVAKSGFSFEQVVTASYALTESEKVAADMTNLTHAEYALEKLKEERFLAAKRAGEEEGETRRYHEEHQTKLRKVGS